MIVSGHTFVAYARNDSTFVGPLVADLRRRGVAIWLDADIPPGADWDRSIDESIRTCANLVIVLSPAAVASNEVRGELRTALNLGKRIVPLLYRPCDLPRQLQNIQYLDFSADTGGNALRDQLAAILTGADVQDRAPALLDPPGPRAARNRRDFLDDVKSEVAGRFAHSPIALNVPQESHFEYVDPLWSQEVKIGGAHRVPVARARSVTQVFDDEVVAGRLLILGAPGSGKTMALLELARELARRAEADAATPMPVLCNLSSWQDEQAPLARWLIEQLKVKYGVHRDTARAWLNDRLLLPLFDGLDEVAPEHQEECVRAINRFQQDHRPKHMVVCCRLAEYENYRVRLQLNGAIRLLPLTDEQIREYLVAAGCSSWWDAVSTDPQWLQLVRSPLLLRLMTLAYDGSLDGLRPADPGSEPQRRLFEVYVNSLLAGDEAHPYSRLRTLHWLAWLGRAMKKHGQTELLIEQLQPTWLESVAQRTIYRVGVLLVGTAVVVSALRLSNWLLSGVPGGAVSSEYISSMTSLLDGSFWRHRDVLMTLLIGIAAGVVLSLNRRIRPIETVVWSTARAWHGMKSESRRFALTGFRISAYVGCEIALLMAIASLWGMWRSDTSRGELVYWSAAGCALAAIAIALFAAAIALSARRRTSARDGPRTRLRTRAAYAMLAGLLLGLGAGPNQGLFLAASAGGSLALLAGLTGGSNELSARRFAMFLVIGLLHGLVIGATTWWAFGPKAVLVEWSGVWLFGGVAVGATTSIAIGVGEALFKGPYEAAAGGKRQWGKCLLAGGISAAVSGLVLSALVLSGGSQIVRGLALLVARVGSGWVLALSFALLFGAAAAGLGLFTGGFLGALFGVLQGVTGPDVERRTVPNQGIRQSALNVGVFAVLGATLVGIPYGVVNVLAGVAITRTAPGFSDWWHLGFGPVVLFGLLGGLVPGAPCIQHFVLRFVLWCFGSAPFQYARFLNYATERMLLERVGGRYRFIHELLRDHVSVQRPAAVPTAGEALGSS